MRILFYILYPPDLVCIGRSPQDNAKTIENIKIRDETCPFGLWFDFEFDMNDPDMIWYDIGVQYGY